MLPTVSRRQLGVALCVGLLTGIVALADLVICPKCGYENESAAGRCAHCQAVLPRAKEEPATSAPEPSPTPSAANLDDKGYIPPVIVDRELQMAIDQVHQGDLELARFLLRNAAALDLLTDPHEKSERSKRIIELLRKCDTWGRSVTSECPACDGTGRAQMRIVRLDASVEYRDAPGKLCPECGGTGHLTRSGTINDRKFRIGRAQNRYTTLQRGKKFVPIGGAWVPGDIESKLTLRQVVQLRRACAPPCPACLGVGRQDCKECNGRGVVPCPNKECENGMVRITKEGQLVKAKVTRTEKCKVCKGKGFVPCEECLGRGSVLCKECNGTGERPTCSRCGGQGLVSCRRCNGSGRYKEVACPTCGGEGVTVCSSCNGDGRKE